MYKSYNFIFFYILDSKQSLGRFNKAPIRIKLCNCTNHKNSIFFDILDSKQSFFQYIKFLFWIPLAQFFTSDIFFRIQHMYLTCTALLANFILHTHKWLISTQPVLCVLQTWQYKKVKAGSQVFGYLRLFVEQTWPGVLMYEGRRGKCHAVGFDETCYPFRISYHTECLQFDS
jgi:hypothetical protein